MFEQIIRYLTGRQVAFRMHSYPMPEPAPDIAPRRAPWGGLVDTHIVLADGRVVLAVVPAGAPFDMVALGQELGTAVSEGNVDDLPAPFTGMRAVPPLGGMMGIPLVIETRVPPGALLFRTYIDDHNEAFVEVLLDELARIERPRSATFAIAGALPPRPPRRGRGRS